MTVSKRNRTEPARNSSSKPAAPVDEPLLTTQQVAELANVSEQTVRRWRFDGDLPFFRLGYRTVRMRRDDVADLLESMRRG